MISRLLMIKSCLELQKLYHLHMHAINILVIGQLNTQTSLLHMIKGLVLVHHKQVAALHDFMDRKKCLICWHDYVFALIALRRAKRLRNKHFLCPPLWCQISSEPLIPSLCPQIPSGSNWNLKSYRISSSWKWVTHRLHSSIWKFYIRL